MSGTVSFNVPELTAHIAKVRSSSESVITTGRELPEKIKMHTSGLTVVDPMVAADLEGIVTALDAEAEGLSTRYIELGDRMGSLGDAVESFKTKSLELTGNGVTRVNDTVTIETVDVVAQVGGGATAFAGIGGDAAKGAPAGGQTQGDRGVPDF